MIAIDYLYLATYAAAVLYSNCLYFATHALWVKVSDSIALTQIYYAEVAGAQVSVCQSEYTAVLVCLKQMSGCAGLTQFQLVEDSAPATQTQKAVTDAVTKSTLSMIGYSPLPLENILTCEICA